MIALLITPPDVAARAIFSFRCRKTLAAALSPLPCRQRFTIFAAAPRYALLPRAADAFARKLFCRAADAAATMLSAYA